MGFIRERESDRPPPHDSSFLETVAAGAVLAVARVAHMDLVELAVHPVAIEHTVRDAAGDADVHIVFHNSLLTFSIDVLRKKYLDKYIEFQ